MSRLAKIYVVGVLSVAGVLSLVAFVARSPALPPLGLFLGMAAATSLLRIVVVLGPNHNAYEGSTVGLVASLLLLPHWLFAPVVVIAHGVEWAWVRLRFPSSPHLRAWYIQPFNMAKCIISGGSAYAVMTLMPLPTVGTLPLSAVPAILLILVSYVAVNQLLLGLALSLARRISFRQAGIFPDAALIEVPLACIGYVAFELMQRGPVLAMFVLAPILLIYQAFMLPKVRDEAMRALQRANQDLTEANQSIRQLNAELFLTLAKVFDMRDPYVGGHAAQVAVYAVAIATEMSLPTERIEIVRQSAYLHDIGKLAIPEAILHKSGRLTDTEYYFIKRHIDIGADLLAATQGLRHLAPFIRHHHERWDGRGYPMGLAGEAIPLESRILNLCDSVEAMASDRPYRRAMSTEEIVAEVRLCAGRQFDPAVVEVFVRLAQRVGPSFVVNSARTVAAQYAASILATEGLSQDMFAHVYGVDAWEQRRLEEADRPPPSLEAA